MTRKPKDVAGLANRSNAELRADLVAAVERVVAIKIEIKTRISVAATTMEDFGDIIEEAIADKKAIGALSSQGGAAPPQSETADLPAGVGRAEAPEASAPENLETFPRRAATP